MIFSSILVLLLIYSVYYTKNKLKYIVIKKTDQIEKTNLQLRTLIDGLWDWNILNNEFIFSEQYEEMLGYDVGSLPKILSTFYGLLHPDDAAFVKKDIQKYFDKKGEEFYEKSFRLRTKDGSWKWILSRGKAKFDSNGHPLRFVGFCTDISEQRDYQDKLEFIAKHDSLTKLPNRFSLTKLLTHSMHIAKSNNKQLALLYIDLDGFKEINDTLGHSAGDEVLSIISSRLKKIIRTNDVVSRIGGDEFVIVITNLNEKNEIIIIVQKCLKEILKEIKYGDNIICVSASIGISFYPQYNEIGNEVLIRQADQAMYEAKTFGKNQYKIFNVEASKELKKSISFTSRVYQAIEENEFVLNYQPKVNMRNNKVIGVEALLRWNHPDKGFLYPDSFLPLIEGQSDLKIELGKWVLQSAFSQLQEWHKLGCNISMNINVSACEIQKEDFSSFIKKLFYDFPLIKPNKIEIEILETASFYNFDIASKTLQECQKLGVSVAIDDFGTGYAAMNYLKKLPINTIKIDKSFIIDLLYKSSSLSIVEGSVGLAKAFNTNIVAEGIESEEHGIILLQFGCELAQGYVIAKAMPAQNIITWIDSYKGFASWNNVKSISENERSVLYARINHLSWFYDIEKFIENTTTYLPQLKESKCYLGEWLKNDGFKEYGNNPIFIDLKVQHEKMHNYVQSILILDIKDKTKEISILKNYSEKILKKLSQLANETNII
jgi:diguanylate cyclase (GGDEF)-like protein/PAS domain S-box-containing protein